MEKLMLEEAINELNDRVKSAEYVDSDYVDCVSVNVLKTVISAFNVSGMGVEDTISRRAAINAVYESSVGRQMIKGHRDLITILKGLPSVQFERPEPCDLCSNLEKGDTLYQSSDWDGGIGFDYIKEIQFCPKCGRRLA